MAYINTDDFLELCYVAFIGQDKKFINAVETVVENTPAADVAEVVRCGQCGNYCKNTGECNLCGIHPNEKDFCSYGVKKDCTDNKLVTQFDYFKASIAKMSIDELSKLLSNSDDCEKFCAYTKDGKCNSFKYDDKGSCVDGVKHWLEQEVSE